MSATPLGIRALSLVIASVCFAFTMVSSVDAEAKIGRPKIRLEKPPIVENIQEEAARGAQQAAETAERAKKKAQAKAEEAKRAKKKADKQLRAANRKVAEAAKKATEAASKKAEEAKKAAAAAPAKVVTSVRVELTNLSEYGKERAATLRASVNAESARAFNIKNWEKWIEHPDQTALDALARGEESVRVEINAAADYLKEQWWYRDIQRQLLSLLLEKPSYVVCGKDLPGPPVWYVNGILTTRNKAVEAGEAISSKLGRRVHVLHNPTVCEAPHHTGLRARGFGNDDLSECVYDRIWPVIVVSRLDTMTESLAGAFVKSDEKLQGNPTTRQLAYVLYYADEPVSLVTFSQGCLIARNAFFTMALLSSESMARNKVAWVAAALPLNDNEIWPSPKRTTILKYQGDPVPKLIGVRGGGLEYSPTDHDFMQKYVQQLDETQIWPSTTSN